MSSNSLYPSTDVSFFVALPRDPLSSLGTVFDHALSFCGSEVTQEKVEAPLDQIDATHKHFQRMICICEKLLYSCLEFSLIPVVRALFFSLLALFFYIGPAWYISLWRSFLLTGMLFSIKGLSRVLWQVSDLVDNIDTQGIKSNEQVRVLGMHFSWKNT